MSDYVSNLIQYVGISENIPAASANFKQLAFDKTFCLPTAKPNIEQIVKVIAEINIKNTKIIKTPKGTSLEGQQLTGWKLIVEGTVSLKIQYVADTDVQTVHAAHDSIPFSTYIVLSDDFISGTPVTVHGYIEDIYSMKTSSRCIFTNITMLLTADFC